jgi:hypothetical protein
LALEVVVVLEAAWRLGTTPCRYPWPWASGEISFEECALAAGARSASAASASPAANAKTTVPGARTRHGM